MSEDLTHKLPGDREAIGHQFDDKINALVSAVQSMSADVQSLRTTVKQIVVRLEALERTVTERSLETKPIWERALAQIAGTRAELSEMRAELSETKAELSETRAELSETKAELKAEINDGFCKLSAKMEVLNEDLLTLRGNQRLVDKRVQNLESKTP